MLAHKKKPRSFETASAYEAAIHDSVRNETHMHFLLMQFSNARQKSKCFKTDGQLLGKPPAHAPSRTPRRAAKFGLARTSAR